MKPFLTSVLKFSLLAMLFLGYSCSSETLLGTEENLELAAAKSNQSILKTLVTGAALNAANGIDIGADGNLYIGSVNGQEIVVMNKRNGKIINRITAGVQSPDDLVFGPDGSLYWTDILTGEVGRRTPAGIVTKQFVAPGVNPIAFNEEGRLFVALDFLGDGLYELDPNLIQAPRPIVPNVPGTFPLGFFNSFDFGPDGRLYGPLFAANLVIAVNVGEPGDPPSLNPFGDGTIEVLAGFNGEFNNPAATKFGPDGLLYILDQAGKVFKLNIASGNLSLFTSLQPGLDNMVFDEDGSLWMTNNDEGWVAEILKSGQARIISRGGMIMPQGLAVMPGPNNQDRVFVADLFSLREFDGTSGQQKGQYKGYLIPVPGGNSLSLPQNVRASGSDLIVSSFYSSTVQVWNPQGGVIEDFTAQVQVPIDAVRLNSGEVIVSDLVLGGVVRMSNDALVAPLIVASGMATDGEMVWVADWFTGDITQIDFSNEPPTTSVVASGLSFPEGLAVDNQGRLLVYETKGPVPTGVSKLTRIDLSSGEKVTIVDGLKPKEGGLPDFPPMWFLDGVDVGPSGDIYIRGGEANTIYKISHNKIP